MIAALAKTLLAKSANNKESNVVNSQMLYFTFKGLMKEVITHDKH